MLAVYRLWHTNTLKLRLGNQIRGFHLTFQHRGKKSNTSASVPAAGPNARAKNRRTGGKRDVRMMREMKAESMWWFGLLVYNAVLMCRPDPINVKLRLASAVLSLAETWGLRIRRAHPVTQKHGQTCQDSGRKGKGVFHHILWLVLGETIILSGDLKTQFKMLMRRVRKPQICWL